MDSNKQYWKGLEELQQTPAFVAKSKGEFAETIPVEDVLNEAGLSTKTPRRDFLKALGFGVGAVTLAACNRTPVHKAVPYLIKPEEITPGIPNFYASSYKGQSVLVRTREGRPILLEANPAAVGLNCGTDAATQASVLDLYDQSKLKGPKFNGADISWDELDTHVVTALGAAQAAGKQIRIVSSTINSPSTIAVIARFTEKYPTAKLIEVDAVSYGGIIKANANSFGKEVVPHYRFDNADVIVSVAADFLGTWLSGEEHTQQYIANRDYKSLKKGKMSRHIQFEGGMSMTGTNADVRVAIKPSEEGPLLIALYNAVTGSSLPGALSTNPKAQTALKLVAQELLQARGRALVVSGSNDVGIQTLTNALNVALESYGSTIDLDNPSYQYKGNDEAFETFLAEAGRGEVDVAFFLNANPLYEYAAADKVAEAFGKIKFKLSFADREDETAAELEAIAPNHNFLESWGDAHPRGGYYTVVQPTINPVYNTRQAEQSLLLWAGDTTDYYTFVKDNWEQQILVGSTKTWKDVLQTGFEFKGDQPASTYSFDTSNLGALAQAIATQSKAQANDVEVQLYQSVALKDGKQANNAYLQELPDPVSKVTWDNYAALNPKFAETLGLGENSLVTVEGENGYQITLPVLMQPGQAMGTVSIAVGYGRTKAGKAGNNVGKNAYPFVKLQNGTMQYNTTAKLAKASGSYELAQTQTHHTIEGRNIIRETSFAKYQENPAHNAGRWTDTHKTYDLWNKYEQPGHKWVMAIDLNACTGCGSCIVACNLENNIPVVGRDEVRRRREMHWIRIDRYYSIEQDGQAYTEEDEIRHLDDMENVSVVHQPMLCQHCEHAPCETVCPVLATVHSSEGLNHMAYNRCFGTRYCANNCPYKVRRFNWFNYWNDSRFDNYLNNEFTHLVLNPDVVSRSRGVMEKCSMCIQRIQAGKLQAKIEKRPLKDGDIKLACASACSANAIIFGDANDPESEVSKALKNERVYYVLEEINVQPGIGYMTKVRNTYEA
ncbi:MAG TPA: TAT-variant-translocated molybdopterin oxidoreductase [Parapedobacter sp.]|uniref:TAT-variant-translocated molybdopterin oxidoreductase n=1 Tax=Parapedobacter sp. TaxID=1958893 RepID=UPI002CE9DBFF|nr:TAT-variant-translocated molybdopterin oxidoreductase [Parapedobacter sp.]HWK55903.1 TAT-variant-translocated molybdopterin oxidoreductase [Parapedobacter sp.]